MGRRVRVDKSELKFGIPARIRDRKHLDWIRTLPCCRTGTPPPSDPAHISKFNGKGMGCKVSDSNAVPLAHEQHRRQHSIGEISFWQDDLERARHLAWDLYAISGDTEKALALLTRFRCLSSRS